MKQHEKIREILADHPHYSAPRIAALMGRSDSHIRTLCIRHGIKLMSRRDLEDRLDARKDQCLV